MAWTTPQTWVDGNVLTAAELNEQVRDNLNFLFSKPGDNYVMNEAADYTTTSTLFVDVDATNLALTITTGGGDVLIWFNGVMSGTGTPSYLSVDVLLDGSRLAGDDGILTLGSNNNGIISQYQGDKWQNMGFAYLKTGLSAGSHTFKLQWKVSTGTATLYAGAATTYFDIHPQFGVKEL